MQYHSDSSYEPIVNPGGGQTTGHLQDFGDITNNDPSNWTIVKVGSTTSVNVTTGAISAGSASALVTADDAKAVTDAIATDVTNIEAKTDFITITQAVDLDDVESKANAAAVAADLAATTNGNGASLIGVEDAAGNFTATDLEGVLIELEAQASAGIGSDTIIQSMMQDNSVGTAEIIDGNVTEAKLNASVNASLDLADSSTQPGDNISSLTNDAGYITSNNNTYATYTNPGNGSQTIKSSSTDLIWGVRVFVETALTAGTLAVGDSGDTDRLSDGTVDLSVAGMTVIEVPHKYASATNIEALFASITGTGTVHIELIHSA